MESVSFAMSETMTRPSTIRSSGTYDTNFWGLYAKVTSRQANLLVYLSFFSLRSRAPSTSISLSFR